MGKLKILDWSNEHKRLEEVPLEEYILKHAPPASSNLSEVDTTWVHLIPSTHPTYFTTDARYRAFKENVSQRLRNKEDGESIISAHQGIRYQVIRLKGEFYFREHKKQALTMPHEGDILEE